MKHTDPSALPADVRHKLLLIRTALIHGDESEANHWLYSIACPSFTCLDPYAALEGRACQCGPHAMETPNQPPAVDELESVYDGRPAQETRSGDRCEQCGVAEGEIHYASCPYGQR